MTRPQWILLALLAAMLAASLFQAPYPEQMHLQHAPTALALLAWPLAARRYPLTFPAWLCLALFVALHIVAARYIYSYVPYDQWSQRLLGFSITDRFGFQRNHFDRLIHFSFGALFVRPVWEIAVRYLRIPAPVAGYVALEFVLAMSALYEVFEWGLSLALAGDDVEAYNGQQGDPWDAQKDMALACVGALCSLAIMWATRRRRAALLAEAATQRAG